MQEQRILIREITNLQNGFLWEMFFFHTIMTISFVDLQKMRMSLTEAMEEFCM